MMVVQMGIPVVLTDDGGNAESRMELRTLFSGHKFTVHSVDMPSFTQSALSIPGPSPFVLAEREMILKALTLAKESNPNGMCMLVRDTSTTCYDMPDLTKIAEYDMKETDVVYLGKWGDGCNLYRNQEEYVGVKLVTTYRPGGFQAVMLSPRIRDAILAPSFMYTDPINKLLSKMIYHGCYKAKAVSVNLFVFDIMRFAKSNTDYEKRCECSSVVPGDAAGVKAYTYFFIAVLIVLVVFLGIGMYFLVPRARVDHSNVNGTYTNDYEPTRARDFLGGGMR